MTQTALINAKTGPAVHAGTGFRPGARAAIRAARRSADQAFGTTLARYARGWRGYDRGLRQPPRRIGGFSAAQDKAMHRAYWLSANVIKADEDKTYPGAFVASPTDPWGQAVPAQTTHPGWTYREVFARDSYETFTGLLADGDTASARAMVRFLFRSHAAARRQFPARLAAQWRCGPGHLRPGRDR